MTKESLKFILLLILLTLTLFKVMELVKINEVIIANQNEIRKTVLSIQQKQMGKLKDDEHLMLSLDGVHFLYQDYRYFKIVKR